jgi:hypothetical protein
MADTTEGVRTVTIDTWVALVTVVGSIAGLYVALKRDVRGEVGALRGEMGDLRMEMRGEFAALRGELRQEVRRLDDKIERLDDRVYGLAVRLQPALDAPRGE